MVFFPKDSFLCGIDLAKDSFKKACVRRHKAGWLVDSLEEVPLSQGMTYENSLQKELKNSIIISHLEAKDLLIRTIEVPLTKKEDIAAALPFQAEALLPYPLENAVLSSQFIHCEGDKTSLVLYAVKKDHLRSHLENFNNLGVDPEAVITTPVALASLFKVIQPSEEIQAVLYFGDFQSYLVLIKKGCVLACRSFDFGIHTFAAAFAFKDSLQNGLEKFKTINHQRLLELLPETYSLMDAIYKELYRAVFSLNQKIPFETLYMMGKSLENESWREKLSMRLEKKIIIPTANAILPVSQENLHRYAIPLGLAIASEFAAETNLRIAEFSYPKPLKRYKKPFFAYFSLIIILACSLTFFNQIYQSYRLGYLKQDYLQLLAALGKNYDEAEIEFKKENIASYPLSMLTKSGLEERIQKIQNQTLKSPDLFPLYAETPRVSDLLAWLSNHPQAVSEGELGRETSLRFDEIHYSMVKKPELLKKKERYLVKVDLEFTATNPSRARAFHDALLAPNPFVDNKHEVEWSCYKNKYRTSFYLKDLTRYY